MAQALCELRHERRAAPSNLGPPRAPTDCSAGRSLGGLAVTLAPAFGYLPALGGEALRSSPGADCSPSRGSRRASRLTLRVGFAATALSLALAFGLLAASPADPRAARLRALAGAAAREPAFGYRVGLAFLIAPSGWIVRLFSPWATGWTPPPDVAIVGDPFGLVADARARR